MGQFGISIEQAVSLLNLERSPRGAGGSSFNVKCPFCANDKEYHLNINTEKDVYNCFACGSQGGTLKLYDCVRHGSAGAYSTKELYIELLQELGENDRGSRSPGKRTARGAHTILPAPDEALDRVYSAMLHLPYLALSETHRRNLLDRGLTEEDIVRSGYATMPEEYNTVGCKKWARWYEEKGLEKERKANPQLRYVSREAFILGFKIASDLTGMGISLAGIPGFFKVRGEFPCVRADAGLLIPTRNRQGLIVGMQTRRDVKTSKGLRYMTLSSKGLPEGVTDNIARTHFPLSNAVLSPSTQILLTEGPLKADAAVRLLCRLGHPNVAFIALQGVAATRELPQVAGMLAESGIKTVYNAFDMDKLVNVHVMRAMEKADGILAKAGLSCRVLLWGSDFIRYKLMEMRELADENGIEYRVSNSITENFRELSHALTNAKTEYDFYELPETGARVHEKWLPSEKGIDDHLVRFIG